MNVTISAWTDSANCTWCRKDGEAVTVTFESGFLRDSNLCWKCLQQAVRVQQTQQRGVTPKSEHAKAVSS